MASVRKLRDGRWQAQYRPVPGGKQVTRTTRRKVEAQRWLDEQTASLVEGRHVHPEAGRVTFGSYADRWAARQVWAPKTEESAWLIARSVPFREVPLRVLARSHIEEWVKDMQTNGRGRAGAARPGFAPATIRNHVKYIRTVLQGAVRDRLITSDPTAGVRLPALRRAEVAMRLPTTSQVRDLLDAAAPGFVAFVALCAFAGLRRGEAAGVQVGDLDIAGRRLLVRRQIQRVPGRRGATATSGGIDVRAPKQGSERTVFLPDGLITLLGRHITRLPGTGPQRWLFRDERGNPPGPSTISARWLAARRAADCPSVTVHSLRHYYASGLIAAGCDVVTVQRALGHSSATVTLDIYAHLWPTAADRTRTAAEAMFAEAHDEPLTSYGAEPTP